MGAGGLNGLCVLECACLRVRARRNEGRSNAYCSIEGVVGNARQIDRAVIGTRACVERYRSNGVLDCDRAITALEVNEIVRYSERMLVGRLSDLRFRRIARLPDYLNGRAFSNIDRHVRANDDNRAL